MRIETLEAIIEALKEGRTPRFPVEDFSCFSAHAIEGNPHLSAQTPKELAKGLTADDIPVFERAVLAMKSGDQAWLGFKIVYDRKAALANVDNEVTRKYGEEGSADDESGVFFCNEAKDIVSSRVYSYRDEFQMEDITRGPGMHNDQFAGLTWVSEPLSGHVHVWLLGASDVAAEVATLAQHVRFDISVVDYDAAYLSEARFPTAKRILVNSFETDLDDLPVTSHDYVCVLTRGHMYDPQGCVWAVAHKVRYVGMMGSSGKNNRVHELCLRQGMTEEQWAQVKRPIGLKFGAKAPDELAIAIVAELIDVRYNERYSAKARAHHEADLDY